VSLTQCVASDANVHSFVHTHWEEHPRPAGLLHFIVKEHVKLFNVLVAADSLVNLYKARDFNCVLGSQRFLQERKEALPSAFVRFGAT
jgi:hypothetical protein